MSADNPTRLDRRMEREVLAAIDARTVEKANHIQNRVQRSVAWDGRHTCNIDVNTASSEDVRRLPRGEYPEEPVTASNCCGKA